LEVIYGEQVTYTYDALNRLASAVTGDNPNVTQWGQSYNYDGFGNFTNQNVIKGSTPALNVAYTLKSTLTGAMAGSSCSASWSLHFNSSSWSRSN